MVPGTQRKPPMAELETDSVVVRVPADADYLPVIRSASAHVAAKAGCTLPEVADLRLAVDEACGLLLRYTIRDRQVPGGFNRGGDLACRFILDGGAVRVVLSREARNAAAPQNGDFGWTILSALVDDIVWRVDGPTVSVEIAKLHAAAG